MDETDSRPRRSAWSAGRYPSMAPNLLPAIARLVNAAGVDPGHAVLDVGCGTGNVALTARRSGARVVGLDLSDRMLDLASASAAIPGYDDVTWLRGDAERLPVPTDAFQIVLSNFGHVFAPSAATATDEMVRAAAPGGRVAFTAWSPDGVVGELTDVLERHVPDPDRDPRAHLRWGEPAYVRERVGDRLDCSFQRRMLRFRYVSPQHFWREFAEESGPLSPVLRTLDDEAARAALRRDAVDALESWFGDNAIRVEYLQTRGVVEG